MAVVVQTLSYQLNTTSISFVIVNYVSKHQEHDSVRTFCQAMSSLCDKVLETDAIQHVQLVEVDTCLCSVHTNSSLSVFSLPAYSTHSHACISRVLF
jgi:hypothetical protein